jgi:hypothetical protein
MLDRTTVLLADNMSVSMSYRPNEVDLKSSFVQSQELPNLVLLPTYLEGRLTPLKSP